MRSSFLILAIAVNFLAASDASSMTTDSSYVTEVSSSTSRSQRQLRAHPLAVENSGDEERSLNKKTMMDMMESLTTKEKLASDLRIADKIDDFTRHNKPDMNEFMRTPEYVKYIGYVNFLNDMAKKEEYARIVQQIKNQS
ncbi:secreted RxLR effector peptide protein, putative [Phytophthora infestans T30-4]|uniref:Secreted RxLR effector peptide protein, putative n=1 Tax=Phytophthora infestans (strain T30-4) TaxID=403677 RepID=D0NME1_PHYIT|nr:secreted RxLR effector peptide protein, putative [Phytophthora infestans T30-4]EEY60862.1 secreted RxLR effector peptide protein, putative [Phytophthora infestans T30-4]KAI9980467.1 hypothetical protein PInf_026327 [Phytophthora infestans]|eukprot:XP_002899808.1 secreted RxLR effector peptide protein, putative [Phytophthora infestans T30-4]